VNGAVTDGTSILSRIDRQVIDGGGKKSKALAPSRANEPNWLRPVSMMNPRTLFLAAAAACVLLSPVSQAQEPSTPTDGVTIELNKLEKSDKGCRAYVVVTNTSKSTYDAFKLDLVMFQSDGIIGRRFALDLAPVRPDKRSVKLFDLDGANCEEIGSFLVNDIMECRTSTGPATDCLANLKVKSLTKVEISK
jgi:hypothetical protein